MLSRLRRALSRTIIRSTGSLTGLTPIGDREADDVFVVGFPKSGNTWMQYLLAGLLCGIDAARCPDSLVQEIVPDVHDRPAYRRHTRPVFFKSHGLPRRDYRRVIYLVRDGRDAMVSYFHHFNALHPAVDFPTLVRSAPDLEARWHEHVEAWLANPFQADLLTIKYEDLHGAPVDSLRRIAIFAGLDPDEAALNRAVEGATFDKQKRREAALGWDHSTWPKDKSFVRRGAVGSFRDEMPPEALALFLSEAAPTLRKLGYPA